MLPNSIFQSFSALFLIAVLSMTNLPLKYKLRSLSSSDSSSTTLSEENTPDSFIILTHSYGLLLSLELKYTLAIAAVNFIVVP